MSETESPAELAVEVANGVAVVELSRPPLNFFDIELIRAIAETYEALDEDDRCRAIVLCSTGKVFCAGANLKARLDAGETEPVNRSGELYTEAVRIFRTAKPQVAAVQGAAVGGGLGLALSADFRVGCAESRFSANFARLGFHQGFGLSVTLPRIVGAVKSEFMFYSGRRVKGDEALAMGLVDQLVPLAEVRAAAIAMAHEIALSAPLAVEAIRATQRGHLADQVAAATDHELEVQTRLRESADYAEGVQAMHARREPVFHRR